MNKTDCSASTWSQAETDRFIGILKEKAYRLLARREYSAFELWQKFENRAPSDIAAQVLDELVQQDMQSDRRFAEMLCRSRFNAGKGPVLLKHELDKHQIDADLIEAVMADYQHQWATSAQQVRIKKFGEQPPTNFKEWTKQARFLQQRGFTAEQIGHFNNLHN